MRFNRSLLFVLCAFFSCYVVDSGAVVSSVSSKSIEAKVDPRLVETVWDAWWVTPADVPVSEYGVYHLRKSLQLEQVPDDFVINLSGDNRYQLYVNGTFVCTGAARGDLTYWNYETVNIAPFLKKGKNVLAVVLWNMGEYLPNYQITLRTGFVAQGNTPKEDAVNTPGDWVAYKNPAYSVIPGGDGTHYLGGFEAVDGAQYPWGWTDVNYNDSSWKPVKKYKPAIAYGATPYGEVTWSLTPREIPPMEYTVQRIKTVRRSNGITPTNFISGRDPLTVPANTECSVLLDLEQLTTAYPVLKVSGGKGSTVKLNYSEALFAKGQKGNRNDIEGRDVLSGVYDLFVADGAQAREFSPLWFRTYRYIKVDIKTASEPLRVDDLYGMFTGYPFKEEGSFASNDPRMSKIWEVGWRTARLCAQETYVDCPYYEQMQYVGDTRIQALISLYVSGDDRLMRQAINIYNHSRKWEGLTAARYPTSLFQYIPPFSLYWVDMVHDYMMHRDDMAFVQEKIGGIKTVLEWYISKIDPKTGILQSNIPYWNFVDWINTWTRGSAPESKTSGSVITTLQFALTLQNAADIFRQSGMEDQAAKYDVIRKSLLKNSYEKCWDPARGLMRDYIGAPTYSQHATIMGILSCAIPEAKRLDAYKKMVSDKSISQATIYYRFYLVKAMKQVGMADTYTDELTPWYNMLDLGLTTFAEKPEPTRSDCHAWSSSPNYDFLATVCGVEPDAIGFKRVKVAPHFGQLTSIKGVVPHPSGKITVDLKRDGDRVLGSVTIPENLPGRFIWKGREVNLRGGVNQISM